MFDGLFFAYEFRLEGFVWKQKYFIKIIFIWEIIIIDNFFIFLFRGKSLSGLVDIAMWKTE